MRLNRWVNGNNLLSNVYRSPEISLTKGNWTTTTPPSPTVKVFNLRGAITGVQQSYVNELTFTANTLVDDPVAATGALSFRLETNLATNITPNLKLRVIKLGTPETTVLNCAPLDQKWVTRAGPSTQSLLYEFMPSGTSATVGSFLHAIKTPGRYRLELYDELNGGVCGNGTRADLTMHLNALSAPPPVPTLQVRMNLHFNDHLGSSSLTRSFSTIDNGTGAALRLNLDNCADCLPLYAEEAVWSFYEPYGERMNGADVTRTDDPRYTDHEYDKFTNFNYMKGRYQMPELVRFLRPDPMRDWDWENPHTQNLYEYVGNNPINGWDPTGYGSIEMAWLNLMLNGGKSKEELAETKADYQITVTATVKRFQFADYLWTPPDGMVEVIAGAGDTLSGGLTSRAREWLGASGVVNQESYYYFAGEMIGEAVSNYLPQFKLAKIAKMTKGAKIAKVVPGAAKSETTVIGRVKDLQDLKQGEKSLLGRLPNQGSPNANWKQNSGVLRQEMGKGQPIRDASPGATGGQYLNAERNLLKEHGWKFDPNTNYWNPPAQ